MKATDSIVSLTRRVQSLIRAHHASGLYTHAYVECGRFSEAEPRLVADCLPDGLDMFDLSSMTKALSTTPLVFHVLAGGDPAKTTIGDLIKESGPAIDPALSSLTLLELLSHRSGLPAWRNFWMTPREDKTWGFPSTPLQGADSERHIIEVLLRSGQPLGTKECIYSDLGFLLLGVGLQKALGKGLGEAFETLKRDVGLGQEIDLSFRPADGMLSSRAIPTSFCQLRGRQLRGEVHDENCFALGGVTGHAGLFGSGMSVAAFIKGMVASELGRTIVQRNAEARREHQGDDGLVGWRQGNGLTASVFGNGRAMGHYGFTGTGFWITVDNHLQAEAYCIVLTNRVISGRINPAINEFRKSIQDLLWQMVVL